MYHLPLPGLLPKSSTIFACLLLSLPSLLTKLYHCHQRDSLTFLNFSKIKLSPINLECKMFCELVLACLSELPGLLPHSIHTSFTDTPLNVPHCFLLWKLLGCSSLNSFPHCPPFEASLSFNAKILYLHVFEISFEV